MPSSKLLDMAAQLNTMQKGFNDFCSCIFEESDEFESVSGEKFRKLGIEGSEDKKSAILMAYAALSHRYRLKLKDAVKKLTGIELEMTETTTIYDSLLVGGMSDIVEKIIDIVRDKR